MPVPRHNADATAPELVNLLRDHIGQYNVGEDGRLFRTRTGGLISGVEDHAAHIPQARLRTLRPAKSFRCGK